MARRPTINIPLEEVAVFETSLREVLPSSATLTDAAGGAWQKLVREGRPPSYSEQHAINYVRKLPPAKRAELIKLLPTEQKHQGRDYQNVSDLAKQAGRRRKFITAVAQGKTRATLAFEYGLTLSEVAIALYRCVMEEGKREKGERAEEVQARVILRQGWQGIGGFRVIESEDVRDSRMAPSDGSWPLEPLGEELAKLAGLQNTRPTTTANVPIRTSLDGRSSGRTDRGQRRRRRRRRTPVPRAEQ